MEMTMLPLSPKSSFSPGRKWSMGFNVVVAVIAVFSVMAMVNYLVNRHLHHRFYLSSQTRIALSPRTLNLLNSLTNRVQVTVYYDRDEPLYSDIMDLLREYHAADSKITVRTVDYYRDPGAAEDLKIKYRLGASTNKNLVIFDCNGNTKLVDGNTLAQYQLERVPDSSEREFRRKPVAFLGEMMFTGAILAVSNPKPLKAYFLQGDGEHLINDGTDVMGYMKFTSVLEENHIEVQPLSLLTNDVPMDCNLLVIAGPKNPIPEIELDRIEKYLNEGGRLLALFNDFGIKTDAGLVKVLEQWGIKVSDFVVKDPDFTRSGTDVIVENFSDHPAVNPLVGSAIQLILPREVSKLDASGQNSNGLKVEEIAFSGPNSYLENGDGTQTRAPHPLIVAAEKGSVKGVANERGTTRILVVGDSIFLGNRQIDSGANRDFAGYAANWLLDRTLLLKGLGPHTITEYSVMMTKSQVQSVQWIFLGAMPGGVLLIGGMVWLRRRR